VKRRLRRAVALLLLALGTLGLLATGAGVWPGSPWVWLAVLALAVLCQVAGDHYDQRLLLARRTERRLRDIDARVTRVQQEGIDIGHGLAQRIGELRADLAEHSAAVTPEAIKHHHELLQKLVADLKPIKEEMDGLRTAGGLRAVLRR
jgi:hypothetical protein